VVINPTTGLARSWRAMPRPDRRASEETSPELTPPALQRALREILRPLVALLVRHQITFPVLSSLLKRAYFEVAEREIGTGARPPTASRLSLLTGLHRKDVRRLREEAEPDAVASPSLSLGARLVAQWVGSPEFTTADGQPLRLPRKPDDPGERPSFEALVASVSTDIRARAVLEEWLRLGVVELDDSDCVRLVVEAFVPARGFDEKVEHLGRSVRDHIATGASNLEPDAEPMFERSVFYEELSDASVRELAELSERLGMEVLQELNRRALELQQRDADVDVQKHRMRFGAFFFRAPSAAHEEDEGDA